MILEDPVQSLIARAQTSILAAMAVPDVEGFLCAAILRRGLPTWATAAAQQLLATSAPVMSRPSDVAIIGLRHALGTSAPDRAALASALRRELARQPLPPAPRAHDDERLMLGIAAGVNAVPDLLGTMSAAFSCAAGRTPRGDVIVEAATWFAAGATDQTWAQKAAALVVAPRRPPAAFKDAVALLWLAAELLEATCWKPTDEELGALDAAIKTYRRVVLVEAPSRLDAMDAAMVLRGLGASPVERLGRGSVVDAAVSTFESLHIAVQILGRRPRSRTSVQVEDEYDVQWIAHALLTPVLPDIVPEDPAPQLAGSSSRLDFTSKSARLGIEIKHLRKSTDRARMREELMVDERQYQEHPYVDTVIAFVFDPAGHISLSARPAFERDLSGPITVGGRTVTYITRVR